MGNVISIAKVLIFRIELDGISPAIWRHFAVRDDIMLIELHEIIQDVMGWTDSHLFSFFIKKVEYTDKDAIAEMGRGKDAETVSVRRLKFKKGDTFKYVYDFGDDWSHTLKVEDISVPEPEVDYPVCLAGARECPPEDCGGPFGYIELLNILNDPDHEEHESMKEWAGADFDPEDLDVQLINDILHTEFDDEDYIDDEFDDDLPAEMEKMSREHMHAIWKAAKSDGIDDLPDVDRLLARVMLEHEDEFFNDFEFADLPAERDFDPESEINPFLHITIHCVVEEQLAAKEPLESYQLYNAMRKKKLSHHDIVHLILAMLMPILFSIKEENGGFDLEFYKSLLRKCKTKKPEKIADFLEKEFDSYFGQ